MRYPARYYLIQAALFALSFLGSVIFAKNTKLVTYITTAFLFAIETQFLIFYTKQGKVHHNAHFEWF